MVKLSNEMKALLTDNLCYVATASRDGRPCVAPKSCRFTDKGRLYYVEWAGRLTYENLLVNPRIAISTCSPDKMSSCRIEGKADVITSGDFFAKEEERRRLNGKRAAIAIVMVDVDAIYDTSKSNPGARIA